MGRNSRELAPVFADFAGVQAGVDALDVGCGSGILTDELARRLGPERVSGADPSELLAACAERVPGADLRSGTAEALPWPDESFDVAVSQLVLHFLEDPVLGVSEMRRVVRSGGTIAACTWDIGRGTMTLLDTFWDAAATVDASSPGERVPFGSEADLAALWREPGLESVETAPLDIQSSYEDFDELWGSFRLGVGLAGSYLAGLEPAQQDAVRDAYRERLPDADGAFGLTSRAWAVRGRVP
jgi:SAM-dependent methyltransferase